MSLDLFIFAGETSGDVHGAKILAKLKQMHPDLKIGGVGGPKMRQVGLKLFMPMENFQVMGFTAVFKSLPKLLYLFQKTKRFLLKEKPKVVLFIDYPGFNLRMAKALRKNNFNNKLIHYICPTVWAHGKKRIYTLSDTLDQLLSIFPFEKKYFEKTSLKPTYVGHPLIEDTLHSQVDPQWKTSFKKPPEAKIISIFPGSRLQEIQLNLPKILLACEQINSFPDPVFFVVSLAQEKLKEPILKAIEKSTLNFNQDIHLVDSSQNFQLMSHSHAAIATSGTINFELAVLKVPTVVVYHLTKINAWIAKKIMKLNLPYYCIVNIICNKLVFPELYDLKFTVNQLKQAIETICQLNSPSRTNSLKGCEELLQIMGSIDTPSTLAANEIGSHFYETQA